MRALMTFGRFRRRVRGGEFASIKGDPHMQAIGDAASRWADVQGNIVPGFKKDYQAFLSIAFPDAASCRLWLRLVSPEVASASEVWAFNALFKLVSTRLPAEETRVVAARWC